MGNAHSKTLLHFKDQELLDEDLFSAVKAGSVEGVKDALDGGANPNALNLYHTTHGGNGRSYYKTPLMLVANINDESISVELAKILIAAGAKKDIQKFGIETALLAQLEDLHPIANGDDQSIQVDRGETALMFAIIKDRKKLVSFFFEIGVNLNVQRSDGVTALIFAIYESANDFTLPLIKAGADLNIQDSRGETAVMCAISKGYKELAFRLIGDDVNLDLQNYRKETALMKAVLKFQTDVAFRLVEADVNLDLQDDRGETALMMAISNDQPDVALRFIEVGAYLNIQDKVGETALMKAILNHQVDVSFRLIKAGVDLDLQDVEEKTALIKAISIGNTELAFRLIESGAKIGLGRTNGKTALDFMATMVDSNFITEVVMKVALSEVNGGEGLEELAEEGKQAILEKLKTKPRVVVAVAMANEEAGRKLIECYNNYGPYSDRQIVAEDFLGKGVGLFKKITEMVDFYEAALRGGGTRENTAKMKADRLFLDLVNYVERDEFLDSCDQLKGRPEELFSELELYKVSKENSRAAAEPDTVTSAKGASVLKQAKAKETAHTT